MFHSDTYGKLELSQIPDKITDYFNRMKHYDVPLQIIVGTDSQNFSDTKMDSVIAVICEGHIEYLVIVVFPGFQRQGGCVAWSLCAGFEGGCQGFGACCSIQSSIALQNAEDGRGCGYLAGRDRLSLERLVEEWSYPDLR